MPLTWSAHTYEPVNERYHATWPNHVRVVKYRRAGVVGGGTAPLIPARAGLYIIQRGGIPVYAGQANNFRTRFEGRGNAVRDYQMCPDLAAAGITIRICGTGGTIRDAMERWLVRFLFVRDTNGAIGAFQNRNLINQINFNRNTTIQNVGTRPAYLPATRTYNNGTSL